VSAREETPPFLLHNGEVVPWEAGLVHVWSETAVRGANVFEGLRGYWRDDASGWAVVSWEDHMRRLFQSARLMRIPHAYTAEELWAGTVELLRSLPYREHVYIRPTIYLEHGRYGSDPGAVDTGMYVVAFPVAAPAAPPELRCCVSTWQRAGDLQSPPRVKAGSTYNNLRLPRVEARERGFDDAILLNARGTVAELTGAALFAIRGDEAVTPPFSAGVLESITRAHCARLLEEAGVRVVERELERTELHIADELLACGTLLEVAAVTQVDDLEIGDGRPGPRTRALFDAYRSMVDGGEAEGCLTLLVP
jgi:branched-chain amino acid aminotransferase